MESLFSSSIKQLEDLYSLPVTFISGRGEQIRLNAIYEDKNVQNPLATVIALHGAPGSHNDFKYMLPLFTKLNIRFIGVNYPSHGYTEDDDRLTGSNDERDNYVQSIMEALKLKEDILFIGHSRGAENALLLALRNKERCLGAVVINGAGLRPHIGFRRFPALEHFIQLAHMPSIKQTTYPIFESVFSQMGLSLKSGAIGAAILKSTGTLEFEHKKNTINQLLNTNGELFYLNCYSGHDHLIEEDVYEEVIALVDGISKLKSSAANEYDAVVANEAKELISSGRKLLAVKFTESDHYLQKHQARFLVECIATMISVRRKSKL